MPNIIVNQDLCSKCGQCSTTCLMGIIEPTSRHGFPSISETNEANCLLCGHCESYCPQRALILDYLPEEKLYFEAGDNFVELRRLSLYMQSRRSVRFFKPEPVSKDIIGQILQIARYAPTGGNSQTVQWLVILDPLEVQRIASLTVDWMRTIVDTPHPMAPYVAHIISSWDMGLDPICHKAPHLIFAHLPVNDYVDDKTDAIIALTHFDLAAPAFGVGACWAGFIRMACDSYPPLVEALGLPDKRRISYALFFGYPTHQVTAIPRRKKLVVEWRD